LRECLCHRGIPVSTGCLLLHSPPGRYRKRGIRAWDKADGRTGAGTCCGAERAAFFRLTSLEALGQDVKFHRLVARSRRLDVMHGAEIPLEQRQELAFRTPLEGRGKEV